jgi:DNA-binding SARP family transcriptional activator
VGVGERSRSVEFRILGPLEVVVGEARVLVKPAKARALLALLLLEPGRAVSADRLIDELWGEAPPASAAVSLRVLVSRLRETLASGAPDAIETRSPGYAVCVDRSQIDAGRFEALLARGREELGRGRAEAAAATLRDGLALWRGAALADLSDYLALAGEAARLNELKVVALEERLDADLACGRHDLLVGELEQLVRTHPFRERLWRALMLALYRGGRQADALAAFTQVRARLVDELGIEPSPGLRALQHQILEQSSELVLASPGPGVRAPPTAAAVVVAGPGEFDRDLPGELAMVSEAFVGRQAEIEMLIGLWRLALAGSLQTALVAGEPGIGKTRLAAELARRAHADGAVVLFGRCDEDLGVPFQPFSEALRAYVQACPTSELATQAGRWAGELARLVPELSERLLGARPTNSGDPEEQRDRLFEAVAFLLAGASQARPGLLVLDDLHWAARPTLLLLRHVLRSREPMRLLLLGTYRDTELDRAHPLAHVLADLRREPLPIERIRLRGLDAGAVGAYVAATGGQALGPRDAAFARILYESTEGNPFFVGEVLRHLVESGLARREGGGWVAAAEIADVGLPEGVKDVIGRRLSRLSEAANRALAVASVAGVTFSLQVLERVDAAGNPDELLDALEEALGAGLISDAGPANYSFSHALIRQTLYEELSSTRRARLHRRIGEAIEQAPGADEQLEALAYHFAEAALDDQIAKAADYALAAGRRALDRLDPEEAVDRVERGIELLAFERSADRARQADLLLALAQARSELVDMEGNHAAALAAADAARAIGSAERLARAALVYWPPAGTGVDDPTLPELLEQALQMVGDEHLTLRVLLTTRLTFYRAYPLGQGFAKVDEAERALALARQTGSDEALAAALRLTIRTLYGTTRIVEQIPLANELLTIGRRTGEQRSELLALAFRHNAHLQLADRAGYDADLAELRRRAAEVGTRRARYILAVTQGLQALMEGRFADVEHLSEQALAFGGVQTDRLAGHPARISRLYWEQGRLEESIDSSLEWARRIRGHPVARVSTARLRAELGDHEPAQSVLDKLMANDLAAVPRDLHWPCVLADLAALCTHLGDAKHARRLSPHLRPYRGHVLLMGGYLCVGAADRFLGMLAHTLGRLDDAAAHYTTALELEQRLKAAPLTARTRYWCAHTLHTRRAPTDEGQAIALLESALSTTRNLGMPGLAADAQELLATSRQTLA